MRQLNADYIVTLLSSTTGLSNVCTGLENSLELQQVEASRFQDSLHMR